jgi:uridine kinase
MKRKPLIIGVAGGTASGKTTIATAIMESINHPQMVVIQHDSYYKDVSHMPLAERAKINFDHPDALETDLMVRHLRELIAGRSIEMPVYDFSTHTRLSKGIIKNPAKVIILEGILIFCEQALRELMDVKIFVDTDSDLRFIRRLKRDIQERQRSLESVIGQYLGTVRPMHIAFVEPSRKYADIIIPEGHNPVSTALVVTMIRQRLRKGNQEESFKPGPEIAHG